MKKVILLNLIWLWLIPAAMAQQQVSGTVTDYSNGDPLPGVNILIQGTTQGTITDMDGNFNLEVPGEDAVLTFSFIGYESQEVPVGNSTNVTIQLMPDLTTLSEVVVVGYGVQKKALNTGANLQVKGENLQRLSTTTPMEALQGQAPGVQISSTSGQPGEGARVTIRGLGTIGNSGPLYVVDGVLTNDISYLNNADIETIDVLKDAASAAIYGSQAANGVVLITTKQGSYGQEARITFDAYYGIQNVARKADLLNSQQYATIMNEAAVNSGKQPYFTNEEIAGMGEGSDWMDEMFVNDAVTQNYALGATGGGENSNYSTSLSYTGQEGIVGGKDLSNFERYNFRINSEHKIYKDIVTMGEHLTFSYEESNGIGVGNQYNNTLRAAFNTSPFVPMYDDEGNFYDNSGESEWFNGEANPYAQMVLNNQNERNEQKLLGDVYLVIEPIEGLRFRTSLGIDYYANESHSFTPEYQLSIYAFSNRSEVNQSMGKGRTLLWDNVLSYDFNLNQDHEIGLMVGSSAFQFTGTRIEGSNQNLAIQGLDYAWLSNATNTSDGTRMTLIGEPEYEDRRLSYFGRVNYNFRETYLLNATFRADGSTRFPADNRWGYFPSVSAGWVLSNESFMETQSIVSFLKLRASWGQVGNQDITFFQFQSPIQISNTNYIFGNEEGQLTPGAYPNRLNSPNIQWETSEQLNLGFDARFLNGRLDLNFDWYEKITKDWLIPAPILATAGAEAPFINGGDVTNRGVELALSYRDNVGEFNYNISVNGSYNKNEINDIPTADGIIHGETNQLFDNSMEFYRAEEGFPIGYFWGLETNGIFQTEAEVAQHRTTEGEPIQPGARPGDVRFVDRDGNGEINDNDRTMIGDPNPDFTFGMTFSADYKGFDFLVLASGVAGNQLVQSYRNQANRYSNYTTAILDRWHGPGSSNEMPRVTEDSRNFINFSDLYIQDGDFLRISNVTLGYDFNKLINNEAFGQVRLYASALNLYTFTNYDGMDPEVGFGIDADDEQIGAFSSGIDLGFYPRPRTYMVGLNITF